MTQEEYWEILEEAFLQTHGFYCDRSGPMFDSKLIHNISYMIFMGDSYEILLDLREEFYE